MEQGLLGNTIRQARIDNNMTQEQLAELVQITPTHLKHIESEHRKPSIEVLFSLASVLHFSLDSLLVSDQSYEHTRRVNELNLLIHSCTDQELDVFLAALRELACQKRKAYTE
ncbi:MAG: helix-turn-helix transcriptional regulator [Agathobacter sp.]